MKKRRAEMGRANQFLFVHQFRNAPLNNKWAISSLQVPDLCEWKTFSLSASMEMNLLTGHYLEKISRTR